jgi:hypothetical protein
MPYGVLGTGMEDPLNPPTSVGAMGDPADAGQKSAID